MPPFLGVPQDPSECVRFEVRSGSNTCIKRGASENLGLPVEAMLLTLVFAFALWLAIVKRKWVNA